MDSGGLFELWLIWNTNDLDESEGQELYRVNAKEYEQLAPEAARLVPEEIRELGHGLRGLIEFYPKTQINTVGFEHSSTFNGYEVIKGAAPGLTFVKGIGLYEHYALFNSPVTVPLTELDWDHFIGFCDRLPQESEAYLKTSGSKFDACRMFVYSGTVRASYRLEIGQVQHYALPHEFIRNNVTCSR